MAFANENLYSGWGPQTPTFTCPQGGAPVLTIKFLNPSNPINSDEDYNVIEALSIQDDVDQVYADWEDTGGSVSVMGRAALWVEEASFTVNATAVDASKGIFQVRVPVTGTGEPGIILIQATLLNKDGIPVAQTPGYLDIVQSLASQHSSTLNIQTIRRMLRDSSPLANRLLEECEYSLAEIYGAIDDCVQEWNYTPPILMQRFATAKSFPAPYMLAKAVVGKLLAMAALWYLRNDARVRGGGVSIDDMSKGPDYQALADSYLKDWKEWVRKAKYALNVSAGWYRVPSRSFP